MYSRAGIDATVLVRAAMDLASCPSGASSVGAYVNTNVAILGLIEIRVFRRCALMMHSVDFDIW